MKKVYFLIFLLPLLLLDVSAQDSFYYTFDKKKPLEVNPESFSITFKQAVDWQKFVVSNHSDVKAVHGLKSRPTSNVIFELKEKSDKSLEEWVQELVINPAFVKDVSWGFKINPHLDVWLTDKLLYSPSPNWNQKIVEGILLKYPEARLQQNELGLYSIQVGKLIHSLELGNALVEAGMVNWAQPDFMGGLTLNHPADPKFDKQYTFENTGQSIDGVSGTADIDINAPEAWDLTLGSSTILVGILDEGVEPHEDLEDDGGNSRLIPGYAPGGVGTGESQLQYEGHGQSVAGLIGASHNSLGIAGVAPNSMMVSAYIEADPATVVSDAVNGMQWLWKVAKVDIINNSYGFKSCDQNLYPAFVDVIDSAQIKGRDGKGCVVIYASGENAAGTTCINFPGNRPNVLTVGAVDGNGDVPFYSPFGPAMDVVVPSAGANSNVRSIDREDTATVTANRIGLDLGNYVDFFGGTSTSCAVASGVAALILSEDPNLTCIDVEIIINTTAMSLGSPGFNDSTGNGLLRADDAVSLAMGGFPVEWLDFKAELINDVVRLEWITANEQNNARFDIQRSVGGEFVDLGSLPGAGTTTELNTYDYTDSDPVLGSNYYRIKQVDQNGSFSYSAVIELSRDKVNSLSMTNIYPNPSIDQIQLDYALPRGISANYQIVDIQGRVLVQRKLDAGEGIRSIELSVADLSPGMYTLVMKSSKGNVRSKRFIISR
ncbi:MAG: S8/S53 family peptidase [Bacteroidota bacterium]